MKERSHLSLIAVMLLLNYLQNIDRHVTGVHEGKKQLKCDYRFAQKLSWKAHITLFNL